MERKKTTLNVAEEKKDQPLLFYTYESELNMSIKAAKTSRQSTEKLDVVATILSFVMRIKWWFYKNDEVA